MLLLLVIRKSLKTDDPLLQLQKKFLCEAILIGKKWLPYPMRFQEKFFRDDKLRYNLNIIAKNILTQVDLLYMVNDPPNNILFDINSDSDSTKIYYSLIL